MKRLIKGICIFILFFIPLFVYAAEDTIKNYFINVVIEESGDILVEEYFDLQGSYNGYERIINYRNENAYDFDPNLESYGGSKLHNGSDIELLEIRAVEKDDNFNFKNVNGKLFTKNYQAKKGDYGYFTQSSKTNGETFLIYLPSKKKKAFYIKYRLKDMVILHNDVAELGWNIFGYEMRENIKNFKATIYIPNNKDELRVWAHGPLHGSSRIIDKQHIEVTINNLNAKRAIDVRTTFDRLVCYGAYKRSYVSALDKIINYEEDAANQANYKREQDKKENQKRAMEYLERCEASPYRTCLKDLENGYRRYIYDDSLLIEYDERIEKLRIAVKEQEEETAIKATENLKNNLTYENYRRAKETIGVLENEELKEQLMPTIVEAKEVLVKKDRKINDTICTIGKIIFIITLFTSFIFYIKYIKNPKTSFNHKYLRELPKDISPLTVSYIFNKKISNDAISSVILRLINKKCIIAEKVSNKKKDYKLIKGENEPILNDEINVMHLIFNGKKEVLLKDLKKDAKKSYNSYLRRWNKVVDNGLKEAQEEEFYTSDKNSENSNYASEYTSIISFSAFFALCSGGLFTPISILIILIYYLINRKKIPSRYNYIVFYSITATTLLCTCLVALAITNIEFYCWKVCLTVALYLIISIVFLFSFHQMTEKGVTEKSKWLAFKRFLKDFGKIDEKELPEVSLWGDYLAYAVVLGCADKLARSMELRSKDLTTYDIPYNYIDYNVIYHSINSTVISSHSAATSAKSAASSGSSSSGSGGGGGFSSGGGSFGGGGGGGRF